jgi:hypothetical protein
MTSPPDEIHARFDALQAKLRPLWASIGRTDPGGVLQQDNTIVVVPSMSLDKEYRPAVQQLLEERFLFMVLLLRQPGIRLVYVSSQPIAPGIVDYYLELLPGVGVAAARRRLRFVSPEDATPVPLTSKLLGRPQVIDEVRGLIPDLDRAHVVPYNTTELERELALRLGIPMYAADPRFFAFGGKSGCRRLFAEEGVRHPLGFENLFDADDVVRAVARLRAKQPLLRRAIVKLNDEVSGSGNALLDLDGLPSSGDPHEPAAIAQRLPTMQFARNVDSASYLARLRKGGGVVEECIEGEVVTSPSAQLRITPLGVVQLLSTHDQILGGAHGQAYLGCRFPADPTYGPAIVRESAKVGARLAREGVVGRFGIDFVVVRSAAGIWQPFAIEVNLRKGGTTAPFLTLQYLTDGEYDADTGVFTTPRGQPKYYVATDHLESPAYCALAPDDVVEVMRRRGLHFDHARQTGVVLHMWSAVSELGRLGLTAIADRPGDADALYARAVAALDEDAQRRQS